MAGPWGVAKCAPPPWWLRMHVRRQLKSMEFQSQRGYRIQMDADGWRLVTPRNLGQAALDDARGLLEKAENCQYPVDPDRLDPPSLEEIGVYVAKQLDLRITHRYFKQR